MKSYAAAVALAGFASSVAAHGFISSPTPRLPGDGLKAACGDQVYNTQNSDKYGNVQGSLQNFNGDHPDCKMWQCKGVPFSDAGEIFSYTAGQVIPMKVEIRAPHDGVANVSIVNTKTDKIIGEPLKSWDKYALTSSPIDQHPDWTSFDITMPDVSAECAEKGACVIQWFWDAPSIDQTYESCIDFTMGSGSGSGSAPAPSASAKPSATAAPASSAAASATASASPVASSAPAASATASPVAEAADLPEQFTIEQFVSWLEKKAGAGAANKMRRAIAARTARTHARAFRN
ncbi:hypothetical protein E8E13_001224 [Curvularia kusanoi]|uniref:Chitin-binding type-4 domain-containing protein n=1 Tax=Curvularia kusanoi TaxID=90978 RepID=A0A9P4TEW1_CURKU|nr:hypothetical protein E8E13_001224 [Curvularia kusanoi]